MTEGTATLGAFARALRDEGVPVGTGRLLAYCRAVEALPAGGEELYWAGRATLVARREDVEVYDRIFASFFGGEAEEQPPEGVPRPLTAVEHAGRAEVASLGSRDAEGGGRASRAEVLRRKSFAEQTPEEELLVGRMIARLAVHLPQRRSRRRRPRRSGDALDVRRTMRRALRTHGEPIDVSWRTRRHIPRRLVLLLDVSGSMEAYTRPLVRFAHAAVQTGGRVEAFTFGTRLTRITPALRRRDPGPALAALGPLVPDWHGGTRIGDSVRELIESWGRRGPLRGAVVVICSDGLDVGDPEILGYHMERLALLARRVVWVNPLAGSAAYEPLARGMSAALPHIDRLMSGHNLESLEEVVEVVREASG